MRAPGSVIGDLLAQRPLVAANALVALTLLSHAIILATPGFFSQDEWQKFDAVRRDGYWQFAKDYGAIIAGPDFGHPVRPIGFLQQGFVALWMQSAPWFAHLFGVLNHALVALTWVWVLRRARVASTTAALAGVLFVLSPLTTMATGWVGASFDQLYVLFLLLAGAVIVTFPANGATPARALSVLLATAAALLSKETAIVAPGAVVLIGAMARAADPERFSWRPYAVALVLVLIPVTAYLLLRAPAIANSFSRITIALYAPDISNVPGNVVRFFSFPFRLRLLEMSDRVFASPWQPAGACLIHLALVVCVYRLFGRAFALAYIAGYFLFVAPILLLPDPGPHYLYGSALAMSLAIATILQRCAAQRRFGLAALVVAGAVALYAHNLAIQVYLYETGACQARFLASLDALLAPSATPRSRPIRVVPDAGVSARVAVRAVSNRASYIDNGAPMVTFELPDTSAASSLAPGEGTPIRMTATCTLQPL